MEVRIGVVYTARELVLETDDSADDVDARPSREPAAARRRAALAHRHEGPARRRPDRQDRVRRDRGRRRWRKVGFGRASRRDVDHVIGPAPDLLDRRCLFFTGKGGVGKSTMAAATALLAADHRQARAARRGRRQGRHPVAVRADAGRVHAARGVSRRARDGDGHRGVAAGVPARSTCACPCIGRLGPARHGARLRRRPRRRA